MYSYEKNGAGIYRQSFAIVQQEADLARFSKEQIPVVVRMIHACGMVDLAGDVVIADRAAEAGIKALQAGCSIVCDVEMVQRGIIAKRLPVQNPVLCSVGSDTASALAKTLGTTRSAAGIEIHKDDLNGAITVIGNAPTALFHLLEMIASRGIRPALIIGCPVGFVGAEESKEALIAHESGIPFVTVRGRRGGSAIASSVINALCSKASI